MQSFDNNVLFNISLQMLLFVANNQTVIILSFHTTIAWSGRVRGKACLRQWYGMVWVGMTWYDSLYLGVRRGKLRHRRPL